MELTPGEVRVITDALDAAASYILSDDDEIDPLADLLIAAMKIMKPLIVTDENVDELEQRFKSLAPNDPEFDRLGNALHVYMIDSPALPIRCKSCGTLLLANGTCVLCASTPANMLPPS